MIAKIGCVKVVVITTNNAPQIAKIGGNGYQGILYGRSKSGCFLRKAKTPVNKRIEKIQET